MVSAGSLSYLTAFSSPGSPVWIIPPPVSPAAAPHPHPLSLSLNVTSAGKPCLPAHPAQTTLAAALWSFHSVPLSTPRPLRSHIMSEYGRMTDTERDQIDQDAQTFMRTCSEAIQQLRGQGERSGDTGARLRSRPGSRGAAGDSSEPLCSCFSLGFKTLESSFSWSVC